MLSQVNKIILLKRREDQRQKLLWHAANICRYLLDRRIRRAIPSSVLQDIGKLTSKSLNVTYGFINALENYELLERVQEQDNEIEYVLQKLERMDDVLCLIRWDNP